MGKKNKVKKDKSAKWDKKLQEIEKDLAKEPQKNAEGFG